MIVTVLLAALASASPPLADAVQLAATARAARRVLRRCGSDGEVLAQSPDSMWQQFPAGPSEHEKLRASLGEALPQSDTTVMIYGAGGHLATSQYSIVLTRDGEGRWQGTAVGQSRTWLPDDRFSPFPKKAWTLSTEEGRRLDSLLSNRCLFAEPVYFETKDVDAMRNDLSIQVDIVTPRDRRHASFLSSSVKGVTKQLVALAYPK